MNAKKPERRYLLILGCSQRKRPDSGLLPAIERYDGVNFRILQKAKREEYLPENLDILILSAKYGLIEAKGFNVLSEAGFEIPCKPNPCSSTDIMEETIN
jgi:hypothetical protein